MAILKSNKVTHEFSIDEIKKLIALDLNIPAKAISVSYNITDTSDDRFHHSPNPQVTSIIVEVDQTKI